MEIVNCIHCLYSAYSSQGSCELYCSQDCRVTDIMFNVIKEGIPVNINRKRIAAKIVLTFGALDGERLKCSCEKCKECVIHKKMIEKN